MNVLSLFDGMSCGRIALERAGIKVDKYFASEIDKHAVKTSTALYQDTIHLGDVTKIKGSDLPKIDMIIGGSPCQGFSIAGKGLNFNDPRSKLFFEFVRLIEECKPKYFFLENVKMKEEYADAISNLMGVQPIEINSALVSAQNRVRLYWTNIPVINRPLDRGILLKDILEDEVDEKYYIKNPKFDFSGLDINKKGNTLRTGGSSSQTDKHNYDLIKIDIKGNIKANQDKASCFTAGANSGGNHSDMDLIVVRENYIQWDLNNRGNDSQDQRAYFENSKGPCLLGESNAHPKIIQGCASRTRTDGKEIEVRDEKANAITTVQTDSMIISGSVEMNYRIRRLTPRECGRLQTVPEDKLDIMLSCGVSNTQLYRMFGNGWTVEVIAWFFQFIKSGEVKELQKQTTLYDLEVR